MTGAVQSVVGVPGAWSTERLAAALRAAGADSVVVDLAVCALRLPDPRRLQPWPARWPASTARS